MLERRTSLHRGPAFVRVQPESPHRSVDIEGFGYLGGVIKNLSATGPAQPADVWELYRRPANWASWSPQIRSVKCKDDVIRIGTTGKVVGPFGFTIDFVITAVDEESREWSWKVKAPLGIRLHLSHGVESSGGGTRTTLTVRGPAPIVLGYAPIASLALRNLVKSHRKT